MQIFFAKEFVSSMLQIYRTAHDFTYEKSRLEKENQPASFKKHEIYFCFSIHFLALTKASIQGVTSSVFFLSSG